MTDSPFILNVSRDNFAEVMEVSFRVPVLLQVFELLGEDPRVNQYRRRMASLLY